MTTYTWDANVQTADWTDTSEWSVDGNRVISFPTQGNFAEIGVGTVDLDLAELADIGVTLFQPMQPATADNVVLVAAGVDLGDGTQLATAAIPSHLGSVVYDVVGAGTLDPTAAIDFAAAPLTIELSVLSQTSTTPAFTSDGAIGGGALAIVADLGTTAASLLNDATIDITGPLRLLAGTTLGGTGLVELDGTRASAMLVGAVGAGQTFELVNVASDGVVTDTLTVTTLAQFQGTVELTREGQIVLPGMVSGEQGYAAGVLTFDNGATLNVAPAQDAISVGVATVAATFSGPGETIVFASNHPPPCFCAGTRIATPRGEVPVERLRPGDAVRLARGGVARVAWVGARRVECRRHPRPESVWPVCIRAGAVAPGMPSRDLWVSPDHAVSVAGHLVPARHLLNGASILQVPTPVARYHHVELARHDLLLAEGLAAESYLDTGNRTAFDEKSLVVLHPEFARRVWREAGCAPLVEGGEALAQTRWALARQARRLGYRRTRDPGLRLLADGRPVPPQRVNDAWFFALPAGICEARLSSRIWLPVEMRNDETDRRQLGVALGRLWLDGREASLGSAALSRGWHAPEPAWRWTDGNATLAVEGARTLAFALAMVGEYRQEPPGGLGDAVCYKYDIIMPREPTARRGV